MQLISGESYLFRALGGYHWLGTVVELPAAENGFVRLRPAHWIADTGRFHSLGSTPIEKLPTSEIEPAPGGSAWINLSHMTDFVGYPHPLPTESK
jgi:hypothetical protein